MASASRALLLSRFSPLPAAASHSLRPLAAAGSLLPAPLIPSPAAAARRFATNRPPKETILLDGCDFEHWLVVMEPPPGEGANPDIPRDEIIDSYIKTPAQVVGSEEEARMKIYSVSTRHYFAFGALVSEELSYKLKELPKVRWVLPDSYLDVRNKDYGGEPFIDGQAVPYDPKYHEEWVINNRRANEPRHKRGDRPRNFDKRRENTYQSRPAPPSYQSPRPPSQEQNQMPPRDASPVRPTQGPPPPNYQPHAANRQSGYVPAGGPNYQNTSHPGYQGAPTPGYQAGNHGGNMHGVGPSYGGGAQGYQNIGYQEGSGNYNNAAPPTYVGRDGPGRHYQ
uniref:MORF/ORRM1/DAG-like MORF domain-containing protein n=1 Tax=Triticum aestivum TaxID=4565 RepID=A0A3B6LPR4_WHEAT